MIGRLINEYTRKVVFFTTRPVYALLVYYYRETQDLRSLKFIYSLELLDMLVKKH